MTDKTSQIQHHVILILDKASLNEASVQYSVSLHDGNCMKHVLLHALVALAAAGIPRARRRLPRNLSIRPSRLGIVVPFTAGSATDIMARLVGPKMVERLGKQVVTDNRPSAGGIVACSIVAEAEPDGHTLMVTGSNFAGSAALYSKLPYRSRQGFSGDQPDREHAARAGGRRRPRERSRSRS